MDSDGTAAFLIETRHALRNYLSTLPPYLLFARAGRHRNEVVGSGTAIVIDGFPRSANTFATIAFQTAQPCPVKIAHHLHAASHVISGVKRGLPTLLLVREPAEAALSEAIRAHPVPLHRVLRAYCRFYRTVLPYLERMVVADFKTVTSDFGSVIAAVNQKFATSFGVFDHSPENTARVFDLIEERERRPAVKMIDRYLSGQVTLEQVQSLRRDLDQRRVPAEVRESRVPRPSTFRGSAKAELSLQLQSQPLATLLNQATAIYGLVTGAAEIHRKAALPANKPVGAPSVLQ